MNPVRPKGFSWFFRGFINGAEAYDRLDGVRMLTQVHDVPDKGFEYHVSISKSGLRISLQYAKELLSDLDGPVQVEQWDEDNHLSGVARHFWAHTDETKRRLCECKADEKPIVEGDYTWREI